MLFISHFISNTSSYNIYTHTIHETMNNQIMIIYHNCYYAHIKTP